MAIKLKLDSPDDLWDEVLKYKIDTKAKNNNEAVLDLIRKGLEK